jgi:hypothetical protein
MSEHSKRFASFAGSFANPEADMKNPPKTRETPNSQSASIRLINSDAFTFSFPVDNDSFLLFLMVHAALPGPAKIASRFLCDGNVMPATPG